MVHKDTKKVRFSQTAVVCLAVKLYMLVFINVKVCNLSGIDSSYI